MTEDRECLYGEVTEDQAAGWTDEEWRRFQFRHMVNTNKRLSKLELAMSWRTVLAAIPWVILGGVLTALVKCL